MREVYEAPEAKLIGFAPMENLAANWDWSKKFADTDDVVETTTSEVDVVYPSNPEGSYN